MPKHLKNFLLRQVIGSANNLVSTTDHYDAMRRLMRGHPVNGLLDAGASDGRVTRKLLKAFPDATAYLFEPQPYYRDALERYAAADARVRPYYKALADHDGELEITVGQQRGMASLFSTNLRSHELFPEGDIDAQAIRVPTVSIDSWRRELGNPPLEVMKFDIQAAELVALRGAAQTLAETTRLIYTEVFFNPLYEGGALLGDIDAWLRQFGFQLFNLYKPKSDPQDMLLWANAIFVKSGG